MTDVLPTATKRNRAQAFPAQTSLILSQKVCDNSGAGHLDFAIGRALAA
jgi:hypothetical protein